MIKPGDPAKSKAALIYGQMTEPPGARLRVALTGLTVAEYFRDEEGADTLLFIDNIFRFTQAGSEVSTLLGRMPSRRGLPAEPGHRNGRVAGAHHFDQERLGHLGAGDLRARRRLDRSGSGDDVRSPGRDYGAVARADRDGHLSGRRSAGFHLAHSRSAHRRHRSTTMWRRSVKRVLQTLQGPAGHHRHSRHRRTERRPEADRGARPQDPEIPFAALPRRRTVHRRQGST